MPKWTERNGIWSCELYGHMLDVTEERRTWRVSYPGMFRELPLWNKNWPHSMTPAAARAEALRLVTTRCQEIIDACKE